MTDRVFWIYIHRISLKFCAENEVGLVVLDWTWSCLGDFTFVRIFWWKNCGDIRRLEVYLYCCYLFFPEVRSEAHRLDAQWKQYTHVYYDLIQLLPDGGVEK